jgi:hypothetical protein
VNTNLLRALSLVAGLLTGLIAILLSLLFISNELREAESAPQWTATHFQASLLPWLSAWALPRCLDLQRIG